MIRTGDRQFMKELNIALVMNLIRQAEPISRVEIADRTGLGRSTVTGIIASLLREGLVQETGSAETQSGRKPVLLTFHARARYAVGVKLGPKSAKVGLVDLNANVIDVDEVLLNPHRGPEEAVGTIGSAIAEVTARNNVPAERLLGVGLVMPGVVNPRTGTAVTSYFLGWADLPIRDILERQLGLPVFIDNDANGMALAEALYGAGQGVSDLLAVTVGVGIGAGVVVAGQIHRGIHFGAGEIGHTCVVRDGPQCACGRRGCLEAVASDAALVRRAREEVEAGRSNLLRSMARGHPELITREMVVDAALEGDPAAREIVAEAGRWLGIALGNAVNLLGPGRIVLGGEAGLQAGELLLDPVRETLRDVVFGPADAVPVVVGQLGANAWMQGAAALVLADAFQVPLGRTETIAMARTVGQGTS